MFRLRSIHGKMFLRYSLLIGGIICVFLIAFIWYMSNILKTQATQSMHQISANIVDTLDLELNNMYSTALKIIASDTVKQPFFVTTKEPSVLYREQNKLANTILSINGIKPNFYKLYLFRNDGFTFEYGNQFESSFKNKEALSSKEWVINTLRLEGHKYVAPPHEDETTLTKGATETVVSISMAFAEVYGMKPDNIIKIEQKYETFQSVIERAIINPTDNGKTSEMNKSIYVFDLEGKLIYPYILDKAKPINTEYYWKTLQKIDAPTGNGTFITPDNKTKNVGTYARSDDFGWTVLLIEPETSLMQPIRTFTLNIAALGLIALAITLFVSFAVSRSLTRPIKQMNKSIKTLDFNTLLPKGNTVLATNIDELEELNQTFNEMRSRLQESLDEAVSARSHEIQSRLLALQSQMNPHFLYNSLSVISILCEENRNVDAVNFCSELSKMLRYVSSSSYEPVRLEEEIDHTNNYISMMKERYGDMIQFDLQIPEQLNDLKIPKLTIQPLVENAIKYGIHIDPPWLIRISGKLLSDHWIITVSDNGGGFNSRELASLKDKISHIELSGIVPEIQLNGMGLLNLYIRLQLFFNNQLIFDIKSNDSGASVTIGGPIKKP